MSEPDTVATARHNRVAVAVGATIRGSLNRGTPWYTSGAIKWLEENLPPGFTGVEYGGGGSTPWWAERLDRLYTVEASTMWAIALLDHMRSRPELIARWRLLMVNCDWRYLGEHGRKLRDHWPEHPDALTDDVVAAMEADYLTPPITHADVVMIDGAIRPQCVEMVCAWAERTPMRMIVVDNMESKRTRGAVERHIPSRFERLDFFEQDDLLPEHKNELLTSVFC